MSDLTYPKVKDLTDNQKDELLQLVVNRLGCQIEVFKWQGDPEGSLSLVQKE